MTDPTRLPPRLRAVEATSFPSATVLSLHAHAAALALDAAREAIAQLLEGGKQAGEVTSDPAGMYLAPNVRDALSRLGEHVRKQVLLIERMIP